MPFLDDVGLRKVMGHISTELGKRLPIIPITKEEYDALSEEDKNEDVIYMTIDDDADSSGSDEQNVKIFSKTFSSNDWSENGTISIPKSEHNLDLTSGAVILETYTLVEDGSYEKTWAGFETYVKVESDESLTLHYPGAEDNQNGFSGKAVIVG